MEKGPFYVKVEEFKDIVDTLSQIKAKVEEANKLLDQIGELRTKEETEIEQWKQQLDEVNAKVSALNQNLFQQ